LLGRPVARAFAVGLAAFRAGQDIQAAVEFAGYPSSLAVATYEKIMSSRRTNLPPGPAPGPVSKSVKSYVKKCMHQLSEDLFFFTALGSVTPGTAGAVTSFGLDTITQGDTDSSRTGDIIRVKQLHIRGIINTGSTSGCVFRMIVFRDLQSNGTTPTVAQVLTTADYLANYNPDTVTAVGGARFKVLWDRSVALNFNIAATLVLHSFDLVVPGGPFRMDYITNGGTSASVGTNNVWILSICSQATASHLTTTSAKYTDV